MKKLELTVVNEDLRDTHNAKFAFIFQNALMK